MWYVNALVKDLIARFPSLDSAQLKKRLKSESKKIQGQLQSIDVYDIPVSATYSMFDQFQRRIRLLEDSDATIAHIASIFTTSFINGIKIEEDAETQLFTFSSSYSKSEVRRLINLEREHLAALNYELSMNEDIIFSIYQSLDKSDKIEFMNELLNGKYVIDSESLILKIYHSLNENDQLILRNEILKGNYPADFENLILAIYRSLKGDEPFKYILEIAVQKNKVLDFIDELTQKITAKQENIRLLNEEINDPDYIKSPVFLDMMNQSLYEMTRDIFRMSKTQANFLDLIIPQLVALEKKLAMVPVTNITSEPLPLEQMSAKETGEIYTNVALQMKQLRDNVITALESDKDEKANAAIISAFNLVINQVQQKSDEFLEIGNKQPTNFDLLITYLTKITRLIDHKTNSPSSNTLFVSTTTVDPKPSLPFVLQIKEMMEDLDSKVSKLCAIQASKHNTSTLPQSNPKY